jgi:hypothetical protein
MYFKLDLPLYMFAIIFLIKQMVKVKKKSTTISILNQREYHIITIYKLLYYNLIIYLSLYYPI